MAYQSYKWRMDGMVTQTDYGAAMDTANINDNAMSFNGEKKYINSLILICAVCVCVRA